MSCKVIQTAKSPRIVPMKDMPGGRLGVTCDVFQNIVMRGNEDAGHIMILGEPCGNHTNNYPSPGELPVRLLDAGEKIEYVENGRKRCRLVKADPKVIPMRDLPGGKLAVIVSHKYDPTAIGLIVVRGPSGATQSFIILGDANGPEASNAFTDASNEIMVRPLAEGETVEIGYTE